MEILIHYFWEGGWGISPRGAGYTFGQDISETFNHSNGSENQLYNIHGEGLFRCYNAIIFYSSYE